MKLSRLWDKQTRWFTGFAATALVLLLVRLLRHAGENTARQADYADAILGICIIQLVFASGLFLLRRLLGGASQTLAVARTVLQEALHLRLVTATLNVAFVVVPLLWLWLSGQADQPLHFRVRNFITYSLGITAIFLSLVTLFMACSTLAREISGRQIHLALVKPIGRGTYLLGKWLGVTLLAGLLLLTVGSATYFFTLDLASQGTEEARQKVDDEVLISRITVKPEQPPWVQLRADRRFEMFVRQTTPKPTQEERNYQRALILNQERMLSRTLRAGKHQTYVFKGLGPLRAREISEPGNLIQLRFKINALVDNVPARMAVGWHAGPGRPAFIPVWMRQGKFYTLPIKLSAAGPDGALDPRVADDGNLSVSLGSPGRQELKNSDGVPILITGIEILHPHGGFAGNFLRSMLVMWLKLSFLAMLGLVVATFLEFRISVLMGLAILVALVLSPYIVSEVAGKHMGKQNQLDKVIAFVGVNAAKLLRAYGEHAPGPLLADGRMVGWTLVSGTFLWVGLIWTGFSGLAGWLIFRNREIARVQA
jgi:hypothetical protein